MLEHPSIFKYSPKGSENLEVRTISREDVVNFMGEVRPGVIRAGYEAR